jgi:hypothetical protein
VQSQEEAEFLAPQPNLQTRQDQAHHERAQLKLGITEDDERRMAKWHCLHPEDVAGKEAFWGEKKAARRERRAGKRFLEAELDNRTRRSTSMRTPRNGKTFSALLRRALRRGAAATSSLGLNLQFESSLNLQFETSLNL